MDVTTLRALYDRNRTGVLTGIAVLALVLAAVGVRAVTTDGGGDGTPGTVAIEDGGPGEDAAEGGAAPADGASRVPDGPTPDATTASPSPTDGGEAATDEDGSSQAGASTSDAGDGQATGSPQQEADSGNTGGGDAAPRPDQQAPPPDASGGGTPGTALPGVTDDEITVVYYWKGDRTRTSPFLAGTGAEGNVDEAESFRKLIDWINANDGTGTLMGHPIDLHGRTLKGVVVDAGSTPEDYAATAEKITQELQPFVAIAAHGSISAYLCPALAEAGIHNLATYDLVGGLTAATDGYCMPSGLPWERQVDLTEAYLLQQQAADPTEVFGVVYAEYPGLVDSAPRMIERLRKAGVNIAHVETLSASLATAQQQAPNAVAQMRANGVTRVVFPDAGAPISFTHAAQSSAADFDYYVWPCSGQDTMGMVRILNGAQWAGAQGLSCYDAAFRSDVRSDDLMKTTEWYRAYQEMEPGQEPPAPTPFVYASLLPLVAGVEGAGPDLTLESWRAALDDVEPYRYDAVEGRTGDRTRIRLALGGADRALLSDAMEVRYNDRRQRAGAPAPGAYDYLGDRRFARPADVR